MITKLKCVSVPVEDLIHIYILYVGAYLNIALWCGLWHSTLTVEMSQNLENVQKLCLKVIMGHQYDGYQNALEFCGLSSLSDRREQKCLKYGLKSLLHPTHSKMFPVNPHVLKNSNSARNSEHFKVYWAKSESYPTSPIPHIQRMLNVMSVTSKETALLKKSQNCDVASIDI